MRGAEVEAAPFVGRITPAYDVVGGRFSLHVGPLRDPAIGLNQKILWVLPPGYERRIGPTLAFTGRLNGVVQYRKAVPGTTREGDRNYDFPSILAPPRARCWTLTLTTGRLRARLVVLVR